MVQMLLPELLFPIFFQPGILAYVSDDGGGAYISALAPGPWERWLTRE